MVKNQKRIAWGAQVYLDLGIKIIRQTDLNAISFKSYFIFLNWRVFFQSNLTKKFKTLESIVWSYRTVELLQKESYVSVSPIQIIQKCQMLDGVRTPSFRLQ